LAFTGWISSEGWIGIERVVSAVALTIGMHQAARTLEATELGGVMSFDLGRDIVQPFDEDFDDGWR
jgi:hypothetical protein